MSALGTDPGDLLTAGQIATLAGVSPSAVSNWRKRHADFPMPAHEIPGGDLFARRGIEKWLRRHNKPYGPQVTKEPDEGPRRPRAELAGLPARMAFWRRLTQGRLLAWLQLAYLRSCGDTTPDPTGGRLGAIWGTLLEDPAAGLHMWEAIVEEEASSLGPDLVRALVPARHVLAEELLPAAEWIEDTRGGQDLADVIIDLQQLVGKAGPALAGPTLNTAYPVAKLAVDLLSPLSGTFYDPAFGMGTMLATGWMAREDDNLVIYGQEASSYAWKVTFLRLLLHGAKANLRTGNTLLDDQFGTLRADRIALQPPWGGRGDSDPLLPDDRWSFQYPPRSQEWLWVHHVLYHLAPGGRAIVVIPRSLVYRDGQDADERRRVLASGVLDAVVDLPPGMTDNSSAAASLLVLDRERTSREDRVLFVDARKMSTGRRGRRPQIGDQLSPRIVDVVREWRAGALEPEARFSASATTDEIEEAGAVWAPSRFIRYAIPVTDLDGEPLRRRLDRLLQETDAPEHILQHMSNVVELLQNLEHSKQRSWPTVRLGQLLSSRPRTGLRKDEEGEGIRHPYVSPAFMRASGGTIRDIPEEGTRGRVGSRLTQPGDLLLTSRGIEESKAPACAVVRVETPLAYSASLTRLQPSEMVAPDYLRLYLTSREAHWALASATSGTTISNLRPQALEHLEIPLPDVQTQQRIVSAATMVEDMVSGLEALADRVRDLSETLHEGLISGVFRAVPRHRDCTLALRFEELKHAVKASAEAQQQLLEPGSQHGLRYYEDADISNDSIDFRVERIPSDQRQDDSIFGGSVTFHLKDDHILIVIHTTTPPKKITVTVEWTDSGCRYVIGDQRLTSEDLACQALGPLFSSREDTSDV